MTPVMTSAMGGQPGTLTMGLSCTISCTGVAWVGLGRAACTQPHEAHEPQEMMALASLAVSLASTGVSRDFLPAIATSDAPGALIGTAFASAVMIGFVEELGWTGYAVPRLLRRSGVQATGIMVGLLWGAWHFPLFWEASSFLGALGLGLLLARLFSWLPPFRVLMVWVYDRTESLLVVALMHVSLVLSTLLFQPAVSGLELLAFVLVWAVALWVAPGAVVSKVPSPSKSHS